MSGFPFLGIGGLTAVAVLVAGYAVFAAFARLTGAAASAATSVVSGIVTGFRDWASEDGWNSTALAPPGTPWEDLPSGVAIQDQVGAE